MLVLFDMAAYHHMMVLDETAALPSLHQNRILVLYRI